MSTRLAWVTARTARDYDEDLPPAQAAFARAGAEFDVVDWDDPAVDWSGYRRVVLRSTWDYSERLGEFLAWLEQVDARAALCNPAPMVRWNLDKRYLADLGAAGVPVIPTDIVQPGDPVSFPGVEFVVKPAVGAAGREVARHTPDRAELAAAHIARLHEHGTAALVQPLQASVAAEGEWALSFLGGQYSHAANRRVTLHDPAADVLTAHTASGAEIDIAAAALAVATERFGTPAYARVDLIRDEAGGLRVLELELVEPSLFLQQADDAAADRLVAALLQEVGARHAD